MLLAVVAGVLVVAVFAVIVAVNRPAKEAKVAPETTETAAASTTSRPIRCLDAAGLSDVEEPDVDHWRGFRAGRSYAIVVNKLARPVRAPKVVAGEYALTGSFKVAAEGAELRPWEGLEADVLVQLVADCLGG
jgi:hypothetical protein